MQKLFNSPLVLILHQMASVSSASLNGFWLSHLYTVMILPLNLLRKLRLSTRQTIGLSAIFGIGFVIIGVAIARLIEVTPATTVSDATTNVHSIAKGPITLSAWSHIEASVAVIVASLPTFRFLLSRAADRKYYVRSPPQEPKLSPSVRTIGSGGKRKVNRSETDTTNFGSINEEMLGSANELSNLNQDHVEGVIQTQNEVVQPKPIYSPETEQKTMKVTDYHKRFQLPVEADTNSTDSLAKKERGFV
jgi:hypothetical protein